ncbi:MAG: CoA transferase [Oscillospiraceae bacterium]
MTRRFPTRRPPPLGGHKLPAGLELDAEITRWFSGHDADEIEETMRRARVPCSRINTVAECMEHPHFRSRDNFVTYTDQTLDRRSAPSAYSRS